MPAIKVLVIDDDPSQTELLKTILEDVENPTCEVYVANFAPQGYGIIVHEMIDLVITDYVMPNHTGFDVLQKVKEINPQIEVVIMTAHQDISQAVDIMKHGALDYIVKPVRFAELSKLLERLVEHREILRDSEALKQAVSATGRDGAFGTGIVSKSEQMAEVLSLASRAADSDAAVLIRGETGTGKEVVAQAIHRASPRKAGPFIGVNIAALPAELIESELFGHQRGAFTGAVAERQGRFEEADGGTLFIDEVGDIPPGIQVKLLRTLQLGTFERVGENQPRRSDVRIISATNQSLEQKIEKGEFRVDFLYRLNVIEIHLPPLRQRRADIPLLVRHFIPEYAEKNRKTITGITSEAVDKLTKYPFPGNVRELENIVERAIVLCRGEYITAGDIKLPLDGDDRATLDPYDLEESYDTKLTEFERVMISEALSRSEDNQSSAARLLGISERRLRSRMDRIRMRR